MTDDEFAQAFARCDSLGTAWPELSVSIARADENQLHVGICIRSTESVQVVHLAWHNQLIQEPLSPIAWSGSMKTRLPAARQRQVIGRAALIYESNGRFVPYGFSFPTETFDRETGEWLLGPGGYGLTCATFVLAIFEFSGVRLLAYEEWPVREEDQAWRDHIIRQLAKSSSERTRAHAAALRDDDRAVRYRPEEVAASAGLYPPTATFVEAAGTAQKLLAAI
jgi:hypothetical protein